MIVPKRAISFDWYASRWGNSSVAGCKRAVARRRLKYPCDECGKPVEKGQEYLRDRYLIGWGEYRVSYYHAACRNKFT